LEKFDQNASRRRWKRKEGFSKEKSL